MKTKKKKTIREKVKEAIKHFWEDDHLDEIISPKLRLATK